MRCLIIHNPASGPSSDEIYAFTHALAQGGDEVVMRFIGDGMEPEDAVADVREFDRVVVSGGDGTVSNVLDQMRGYSASPCISRHSSESMGTRSTKCARAP